VAGEQSDGALADSNKVMISFCVPDMNTHQADMQQNGGGGMGSSSLAIIVQGLLNSNLLRKCLSDGQDSEKQEEKKKYE
jgi:hypothetical protein